MKKLLFCIIILFAAITGLHAQAKYMPKFLRRMVFEDDSSRRSSFIPLPVFGSTPETGFEFGGSALYSFYTDTVHRETHVSNIFGYAIFTTQGQSRFSISTSRWYAKNLYHYTGYLSYANFPSDFYGVGNNTLKVNDERISEKRFKANIGAQKLVAKGFYLGFIAGGISYRASSPNPTGILETDPLVQNPGGGDDLFIGPSFIFDTRDNNTYTNHGVQLLGSYSVYKGIFGSNSYTGGLLALEAMQYNRLSKKFNLAFDVYGASLMGGQSPFYLLPLMGGEDLMRGYYSGRYRDRNYTAAQAELRYRVAQRFGITFFGGTGEVFNNAFSIDALKPNYGAGLRYFFDVEKGLDLRLDYGFGEQRPGESRQSGFYISLGEAF